MQLKIFLLSRETIHIYVYIWQLYIKTNAFLLECSGYLSPIFLQKYFFLETFLEVCTLLLFKFTCMNSNNFTILSSVFQLHDLSLQGASLLVSGSHPTSLGRHCWTWLLYLYCGRLIKFWQDKKKGSYTCGLNLCTYCLHILLPVRLGLSQEQIVHCCRNSKTVLISGVTFGSDCSSLEMVLVMESQPGVVKPWRELLYRDVCPACVQTWKSQTV